MQNAKQWEVLFLILWIYFIQRWLSSQLLAACNRASFPRLGWRARPDESYPVGNQGFNRPGVAVVS